MSEKYGMKKCPACDFENDDRSVSCFDCGVIMDEYKETPAQKHEGEK